MRRLARAALALLSRTVAEQAAVIRDERAWLVGVLPFLGGALIKNALGAFLLPTIRRGLDRRHR